MKMKMWLWSIGGCFFAMQALACFRQRDAFVNIPVSHFLAFYGTASLISCGLYFTFAFAAFQGRNLPEKYKRVQ